MPDRDLSGDDLKLVRYKVLFTKREYEHAFPEKEELVYDDMDGTRFIGWKIAEFVQHLKDEERTVQKVPNKLGEYLSRRSTESEKKQATTGDDGTAGSWSTPPPEQEEKLEFVTIVSKGGTKKYYIQDFPQDDKKYLRLFFEVLDRFPREEFKYEERQIEVLEQISKKMDRPKT